VAAPKGKYLLAGIAAIALVAIAASIAFHRFADPDKLRKLAQEKALATLSRNVTIGDMSLRLLPWPLLTATGVDIADVPGEANPWHLHADKLEVTLAFWPLLSGNAKPSAVHVKGDVTRHGQKLRVDATLDDVSHRGEPDAASEGRVDLDFGKTRILVNGRIPLQPQLRGASFTAQLDSPDLNDLSGFFTLPRPRPTSPAHATLKVRSVEDRIEILDVDAVLGRHKLTGDAHVAMSGPRPVIDTHLQFERLDWAQLLLDAGGEPLSPLPPDEVFYDRPIAWQHLAGLQGKQGTIDLQVASLRLRNGVELSQVKADMAFDDDKLHIRKYTANLLGGSAFGTMQLEGVKKTVKVSFEGKDLLLERWFKERGRTLPFTGGPMAITANLDAYGNSMRDLSKTLNGPIDIRMGPGVYASQKAGDAEAVMLAFSKKDSTGRIDFECASGHLPFVQGVASGEAIVGARSDVMRLLTSGHVSYLDNSVDLHGRLRPKPGSGVGLAAIAGDIRIGGNMRALKTTLDPASTPKAVVRAGVAVATLGLSLAGSVAANNAREDTDPCEAVTSRKAASVSSAK
jgi:AsmA family/AsmA-like C-terminal region